MCVCGHGRAFRDRGGQAVYQSEDFKEEYAGVLNGDGEGGGDGSVMKEGSKTDPSIGTYSPFWIAVVDIAHDGLSLDFSVDIAGKVGEERSGEARGEREVFAACDKVFAAREKVLGKGWGGMIDTDFLVSPFHLGRESLFEGVAEGRRKTGSNFQAAPRIAVRQGDYQVVWENG